MIKKNIIQSQKQVDSLIAYGRAPGGYRGGNCKDCGVLLDNVAKRAYRCRNCASLAKKYDKDNPFILKTYKHNTLGWIVKKTIMYYHRDEDSNDYPIELIENSKDWILQPEGRDWIDDAVESYYGDDDIADLNREYLREAIELHIPKITENDLIILGIEGYTKEILIDHIKKKGLYKE